MGILNKLFGGNNDAQNYGKEYGQQLAEQGINADTANWQRIRQLAEESGLDTVDFSFAVHTVLEGNIWCAPCKCVQAAQHVCFD